jgi:ABC-type oligopeptide transport system ATPase subunit
MAKENEVEEVAQVATDVVEEEAVALTAEQMVANYENDVKAYTKALEDAVKQLKDYNEQLEIDSQMWDILDKPGSIRRLDPMFVYEKDPKWSELQQKKQYYKIRQDRAVAEGTVKQYEDQIVSITEALKSANEKLDKFGGN